MRKIFFFSVLLVLSVTVFGQQTNLSSTLTRKDYLAKCDNQKKTAKILLVGGAVMSGVGLGITLSNVSGLFDPNQPDPNNNGKLADILGYSGLVIAAASIPFFIASSKNKKKAMSMSFKNQIVPQFQGIGYTYRTVPSLRLKISL